MLRAYLGAQWGDGEMGSSASNTTPPKKKEQKDFDYFYPLRFL
jgi:hypothetical protein